MTKMITCSECGEVKPLLAKNMCKQCYHKQHHKQYYKNKQKYYKEYSKNYRYKNGGKSISENKTCSSYLGIYIAEQVLSKIFKNVEIMPFGNPGYDFKCNNGFLIDVKSSCRLISNYSDRWCFCIKRNKIPDYFLLLAFDNRTNLNPEHIWLIPSKIINNKFSMSISESKINKLNEYKLDINKVIDQCNIIKGDNSGDI